ncbi:MAG: STAS domain-containing protein [Desulfobacter sp.]|nr:MAG: STAS domain-containing protein [Desulfobacter sp.]
MTDYTDDFEFTREGPGGAIHEARGCLVVPVDAALNEDALERLGKEILQRLGQSRARQVIINVSGVSLLSSHGFGILRDTARAVGMMGSTTVFAGFQAGVVSSLVDLDVDFNGISAVGTMAEAFDVMERRNTDGSPL